MFCLLFIFSSLQDMANKYSFTILLIFCLVGAAILFEPSPPMPLGKRRIPSFYKRVILYDLLMPFTDAGDPLVWLKGWTEDVGRGGRGGVGRWNKTCNWGVFLAVLTWFHLGVFKFTLPQVQFRGWLFFRDNSVLHSLVQIGASKALNVKVLQEPIRACVTWMQ